MIPKEHIIIFILLCIMAYGLGYWYGMPTEDSDERAEANTPPAPTVVTNIVTTNPQATPPPARPQPTPPNIVPANTMNPIIEAAIRKSLKKPTGELTKADLEKVTVQYLRNNKLTEVPKGLEKLTRLRELSLIDNPALTKAQIAEVQKALLKCKIISNPTK